MPEKMSAVQATHDGKFCIGGGVSGALYVWEVFGSFFALVFARPLHACLIPPSSTASHDALLAIVVSSLVCCTPSILALPEFCAPLPSLVQFVLPGVPHTIVVSDLIHSPFLSLFSSSIHFHSLSFTFIHLYSPLFTFFLFTSFSPPFR